jgi:ribosome maturation factor RimP
MEREETMKLDTKIEKQLADMVADEDLVLVATELSGHGPKAVLRLVVDGPDGVSLDQCASVSRQASAMLDVEDPIQHTYTLEVSSPGLERKLYSPEDFQRYAGQSAKIRMKPSFREHRVVIGELVGLAGDTLRVRTEADETIELPFGEIFEARLQVDWNAVMKKGKAQP